MFENYQQEDEDPDAPDGFYDMYLESNFFDLLQDNAESNYEIVKDATKNKLKAPPKKGAKYAEKSGERRNRQ